jgi:large conductance mechanosensitive channel
VLKEFKEFAMKGNVVDMAVGVVIGGAFGAIVASLVGDVIMPMVGMLTGGIDFKDLFIPLKGSYATLAEATKAGAPVIAYGKFINSVINFLIIAFSIFMVINQVSRFQKPAEIPPPAAPTTKDCPMCCTAIPILAKKCPHCTSTLF